MQFFDLNIPYLESDKNIPDIKTRKQVRLQTLVRAVELGYSGIAFNRTIKGPMSQSHVCTIPRFPLSSLLNLHSSLSSTASFHRRLLSVPLNASFRQYTRLTFVVDSDAHSSALNSGNPVLNTYDLVAVRPLNQTLFDHACTSAQVDMISIDFGKKLPFRLKISSVKAAIERGVYFEIMYSSFLEDSQVKRQMISTAKLLVDWTRGKNLIVSSAAPSYHELRGPNDVTNLLHLLGMSNEKAKAAISRNCSLLILRALRKKQFYKEAIRVEILPAGAPTNPKEPWIIDFSNWDPLSSGEGDLRLEDLAKSFAESGKATQTVNSIDFTSLIDTVSSHDKQSGDTEFRIAGKFHSSGNVVDIVSSSNDLEEPKERGNQTAASDLEQALCLSIAATPEGEGSIISPANIVEELNMPSTLEVTLSPVQLGETRHHDYAANQVEDMVVDEIIGETVSKNSSSNIVEELNLPHTLEEPLSPLLLDETRQHGCAANQAEDMVFDEIIGERVSKNASLNIERVSISRNKISDASQSFDHNDVQAYTGQLVTGAFNKYEIGESLEVPFCAQSNSLHPFDSYMGNHLLQLKPDLVADGGSTEKMANMDSFVVKNNADDFVSGDVHSLKELASEPEQNDIHADEIMSVDCSVEKNNSSESPCVGEVTKEHEQCEEHQSEVKDKDLFYQKNDDINSLTGKSMVVEELKGDTGKQVQEFVQAEHQRLGESKSGNLKVKRSTSASVIRFPFKRFLITSFKRNGRTSMYKTKKRWKRGTNPAHVYVTVLEKKRGCC